MVCTFFGHRDTPKTIQPLLVTVLRDLIEYHAVNTFYVGHQGAFDHMVQTVLCRLRLSYPHIHCFVVLAYMPGKAAKEKRTYALETIYPEGLESSPPRFAIFKRNQWMVEHADIVVTYVARNVGGAATFKEMGEKKGKRVINIISPFA